MTILVAEDDYNTRLGLVEIFEEEGYKVLTAETGSQALAVYKQNRPDILCLDIMMPEINGYDVCRKIRQENTKLPIIFISAKSEEIDKVLGLEIGADDYISKPFGVREVVARIRAVTRRYMLAARPEAACGEFRMGDLQVIPPELRAYRGSSSIELSLRDLKILSLLYAQQGRVVDRNQLFDVCWAMDYLPNSRTLDQHISQLRKKIELDPKNPVIIKTVHNAGYRYDDRQED